jgi:ABC-2 type transport system ATP-binding protein
MGTPASLKESEGEMMRLELIMEPGAAQPSLPPYYQQPVIINRRILGRINPAGTTDAIAWARGLKDGGAIEEFSLGPSTLEDVYIRLVKNPEGNGNGHPARGARK